MRRTFYIEEKNCSENLKMIEKKNPLKYLLFITWKWWVWEHPPATFKGVKAVPIEYWAFKYPEICFNKTCLEIISKGCLSGLP